MRDRDEDFEDDYEDLRDYALNKVRAPAISLIVVAGISIAVVGLGLLFDAWLLSSGAHDQLRRPRAMSKETQLMVRMIWGVVMLGANIVTLIGGLRMQRLTGYSFARIGAIIAIIPCVSPCLLLGIPFGIWGMSALNDQDVRKAFDEH